MSALALSVLLSFVSALAYAGGAIVQERVAVASPGSAYLPLRRPSWWGALALNGLGGLLHVVALAYGPLSIVQPLGALTIVFALPLAALCFGRRAGATAWRGAVMATVGLAGLLSLVGSSDDHALGTAQRAGVALVTGGAVVALMCAGRAAHRHPAVRSVLLAAASGTAFGMSSVFTKTVAVDWSGGLGDLSSLALIGVFGAAGVLLSQASYQGGGLAAPLATLTVVNPVLAAAVGILMFGETFRYGATGTALALGCGVLAAGGLIMLTTERIERTAPPAPAPDAADVTAGETLLGVPQQRVPALEPAARDALLTEPEPGPLSPREAGPGVRDLFAPAPGDGAQDTGPGLRDLLAPAPGDTALAPAPEDHDAEDPGTTDLRNLLAPAPGGGTRNAGPGLRDLLAPAPGGAAATGARGAEASGAGMLPASYTALPASAAVPLPVLLERRRARVRS